MQELLEEVINAREIAMGVDFRSALDFVRDAIEQDYLEKEKDVMCEFAKCCTSNGSMHEIDYVFNETFYTEECYHKGKYTYNKETFECHKCGLIVPNEYRFNSKEK